MAYSVIKKPSDYFNTKLYTGNNNITQTISGVGFQPDWVWIKNRDNVEDHYLFDAVRGSGKILSSANTNAEADLAINTKPTIASDGFTLTSNGVADELNFGTRTYASWNWLGANGTSANTDGSISSTVSANTTSGFSIVSYTGTGSAATVGHSLGVVPSMIITKRRDSTSNWMVYHSSLGATKYLQLETSDQANTSSTRWNDTEPTSSVFTVGTSSGTNPSSGTMIAYCFADVQGFSKFGSYTGNGNADGPFVYTGFKPAWILIKRTSTAGNDWGLFDNKRLGYNVDNEELRPSAADVEQTDDRLDILSNGFKIRLAGAGFNASGDTFIYMAFASEPLVGDNPATAR